jgi:hypothetical protein
MRGCIDLDIQGDHQINRIKGLEGKERVAKREMNRGVRRYFVPRAQPTVGKPMVRFQETIVELIRLIRFD